MFARVKPSRADEGGEANRLAAPPVHAITSDARMDDIALMQRLAKGDRSALETLVETHMGRAFGVAYRMVGQASDAEDMVQDAFIKLWQTAPRWDASKGTFQSWFYRILTNHCLDHLRARKHGDDSALEHLSSDDDTEANLAQKQHNQRIYAAVSALPERQKIAITLCYYEGFSTKEAAEIMDIKLKALEGLLGRGRKALKQRLSKEGLA